MTARGPRRRSGADRVQHSHLHSILVLLAAVAIVGAACTASGGDGGPVPSIPPSSAPSVDPGSPEPTPGSSPSPSPTLSPEPSPSGSPEPSPSASPAGITIVRAYFLMVDPVSGEPGLVPVLREVPKTVAVATAAVRELLEGPNERELAAEPSLLTTVPAGTELLGISIADRIATVDLTREFQSGGGSESVISRLAQVVYTVTQFPTVDAVTFRLDGEPVTVFSGEGVLLDEPVGREDYYEQLPEIFVDRPAWGATAGNPLRVTGLTRVFEATFAIRVFDADGSVVADVLPVTATCGTGCWGTFDVTIPYDVPSDQWGTLRVYELSAKDGQPINIRDYPVWLTEA